jgi:hypothetical protein
MKRRDFLKTAAAVAAPLVIPRPVLSAPGQPGANDRISMAGIGIGGRGSGVLGEFLSYSDVQCVAVCDARADRRERTKNMVDSRYGNHDCVAYRDFRELLAREDLDALLITTGSNNHAMLSMYAARAGKDMYCEKPCTKTIAESLALAETIRRTGRVFQGGMQRRNVPNFELAIALARTGKLGKLQAVHAHPGGMGTQTSGWPKPEPEPTKDEVDWDLFLGTAAWRPFSRGLLNSGFEKGGGMVGGGVLEWGSHCIDMCQWANNADDTVPIEYSPVVDGRSIAMYANGVKLVLRNDGWLPLGSCPVRFEGETGWVETGDSGRFGVSSQALLTTGLSGEVGGEPHVSHVRDFLNCVKSRAKPRVNADVACQSHIACHAANIAIFLGRKLAYDPKKNEFLGDEEANRLRGEAAHEPWRTY